MVFVVQCMFQVALEPEGALDIFLGTKNVSTLFGTDLHVWFLRYRIVPTSSNRNIIVDILYNIG